MKKILTFCAALALSGTGAFADSYVGNSSLFNATKGTFVDANVVTPLVLPDNAGIAFNIDISGMVSLGDLGVDPNDVILFDTGLPGESVNGLGWDVNLEAGGTNAPIGEDASWLSEAFANFDNSTADSPDAINVTFDPATDAPGGPNNYSSGGVLKLIDAGLANILLPDGIVRIELAEAFDDAQISGDETLVDAAYRANSTLTVQMTPEPASLALLAIGGIAVIRRRR